MVKKLINKLIICFFLFIISINLSYSQKYITNRSLVVDTDFDFSSADDEYAYLLATSLSTFHDSENIYQSPLLLSESTYQRTYFLDSISNFYPNGIDHIISFGDIDISEIKNKLKPKKQINITGDPTTMSIKAAFLEWNRSNQVIIAPYKKSISDPEMIKYLSHATIIASLENAPIIFISDDIPYELAELFETLKPQKATLVAPQGYILEKTKYEIKSILEGEIIDEIDTSNEILNKIQGSDKISLNLIPSWNSEKILPAILYSSSKRGIIGEISEKRIQEAEDAYNNLSAENFNQYEIRLQDLNNNFYNTIITNYGVDETEISNILVFADENEVKFTFERALTKNKVSRFSDIPSKDHYNVLRSLFYSSNIKNNEEGLFSAITYSSNLSFLENGETESVKVKEHEYYDNTNILGTKSTDFTPISTTRKTNFTEGINFLNNGIYIWYLSTKFNSTGAIQFVAPSGRANGYEFTVSDPDNNNDGKVEHLFGASRYYTISEINQSLGNLKNAWIFLNIKGAKTTQELVKVFLEHGASNVVCSFSEVTFNGSGRFFYRLLEDICKNENTLGNAYLDALDKTAYRFSDGEGDVTLNYIVFGDSNHKLKPLSLEVKDTKNPISQRTLGDSDKIKFKIQSIKFLQYTDSFNLEIEGYQKSLNPHELEIELYKENNLSKEIKYTLTYFSNFSEEFSIEKTNKNFYELKVIYKEIVYDTYSFYVNENSIILDFKGLNISYFPPINLVSSVSSDITCNIINKYGETVNLDTRLYINNKPFSYQNLTLANSERVNLTYNWYPIAGNNLIAIKIQKDLTAITLGKTSYAAKNNVYLKNLNYSKNPKEDEITNISVEVYNIGGIMLNITLNLYIDRNLYSSKNIILDANSNRKVEFQWFPNKENSEIMINISNIEDDVSYSDNNISGQFEVIAKEEPDIMSKIFEFSSIALISAIGSLFALLGLIRYKKAQKELFER